MTLNCNGTLLDFSTPKVMGILNVTEDSFFDGGNYLNEEAIVAQVKKMVSEGMDILDIGAMSSRPGANIIPIETELHRLTTALDIITSQFKNVVISIDTIHSSIVKSLASYPIHIINDISGGQYDDAMYATCAQHHLAYIMMHMQGTPDTMQQAPTYDDVVYEVMVQLRNNVKRARTHGLNNIIIDPGFGFGKTVAHNYDLLKNIANFKFIDCPILVGVSRKSMIYKVLENTPQEALNGTTALHMAALLNGAHILRVHDVKEAKEVVALWQMLIR